MSLLVILISIFFWMYYPSLGSYPLRDWDESIYAQVARQSHDPLAFQWDGLGSGDSVRTWFEKPPLIIWITQLSQHVLGVNELAARASMPLFVVGTLIVIFLWAKDTAASHWAGLLAAAGVLVIPHYLIVAGLLTYDIPVAFFMCLALFCYGRRQRAIGYVYAFWLAVGLGVLTKSVVGLLPIPIVLLDSLFFRDFRWLFDKRRWWGPLLFLVVAAPWHIVETLRFGSAFWHIYFYVHVLVRGTSSLENHGAPFWYYVYIFQQHPFFELCLLASVVGVYQIWQGARRRAFALPLIAGGVVFLFFSISVSKLVHYIVPFYPFAALLIGLSLYWVLTRVKQPLVRWGLYVVTFCVLLLAGYQTNQYRLIRMQGPVYTDVKEIAEWIGKQENVSAVEYHTLETSTEVIDGRPLLVYYLNRPLAPADTTILTEQEQVYRTRTHLVYRKGDRYVVVAARYIP